MKPDSIFLQLNLCKSSTLECDNQGNVIFEVEASNENLDLEQQRVLQQALLHSKDYFLSNGVVSKDHLHRRTDEQGNLILDDEMVIGEPIDVYTKGTQTFVRGILYKTNKYAQQFIEKLKDGSTRVKASVGGLFPVVKPAVDGVGEVVSVLWNDLALTLAPVNPTVGSAALIMGKSLNSAELLQLLAHPYDFNPPEIALIPEEKAVVDLLEALCKGTLSTLHQVLNFLQNYGFTEEQSLDVVKHLIDQHEEFDMSIQLGTVLSNLKKSLGLQKPSLKKSQDEDDLDFENLGEEEEEEDNNPEEEEEEDEEEQEEKNEETEDITPLIKGLFKQNKQLLAVQKSMGLVLMKLAEQQDSMAKSILNRRGVLNTFETHSSKNNNSQIRHKQFTQEAKAAATDIMKKALSAGSLTLEDCVKIEQQINQSIRDPSFQLDNRYVRILAAAAGK
jgi:hypothetical protein